MSGTTGGGQKTSAKPTQTSDATKNSSSSVENNRNVLRWPLFLPSGDMREIQITDIANDNPVIGYASFPRAGTMYGLDILRTRINHLYAVASNYIPVIFSTAFVNTPPPWKSDLFPVVGSGLNLLEFEYENYSEAFEFDANREGHRKPTTLGKTPANKTYTAAQLIFGFKEAEHNWIRPDINISTGRLDGITRYQSTYYSWLGQGPDNLYREYRIDEKWVWNCYATEFRSPDYDMTQTQKFFEFAIKNGGEYEEEWKLVKKSSGYFNHSLFSVFNVNPTRSKIIFENYNFRIYKKWHDYKPLKQHGDILPDQLHSADVSFFEDDLMPTWKGAVDIVINKIKKENEGIMKPSSKNIDLKRLTVHELTTHILTNYHNFVEYCNANCLKIQDFENIKHLPEYIEFAKGLSVMVPSTKESRALNIESMEDYFEILNRIDLFATSIETSEKKVDERLEKLLIESSLMRSRFISVVNIFKYRIAADHPKNKAMMSRLMLNCLNHKKELSLFEKNFIDMVDSSAPTTGHTVLVFQFHEKLKETIGTPSIDPTLQVRDFKRALLRNCQILKSMFKEIKTMSLEQGSADFKFTTVH